MTLESLPTEKSITGRGNSATTSRRIWIASSSSRCRCGERLGAEIGCLLLAARAAATGGAMGWFAFSSRVGAWPVPVLRNALGGRRLAGSWVALLFHRGSVNAAFGLVESAPAAGARILSCSNDRRAGRAADREKALRDQRMRRQAMLGDIGRDVGHAPARQRVDLDVAVVGLEHRQVEARRRLEPLAAADPGVVARERALQWRHLAEGAATVGIPGRAAEVGIEPGHLLRCRPGAADAAE